MGGPKKCGFEGWGFEGEGFEGWGAQPRKSGPEGWGPEGWAFLPPVNYPPIRQRIFSWVGPVGRAEIFERRAH